jgi:cystathionine gamma-synthase
MNIETLAVHSGLAVDPSTGAVTPPIHLSNTFERDPDGGYSKGFLYTRIENPNRSALEIAMTELEGGEAAAAFSSGMAAAAAVFTALTPGDHVLAPTDVYHGTAQLLGNQMTRWGLDIEFIDMGDLDTVRAKMRPDTRLVWTETPSNPLLTLTDLTAVAGLAGAVGAVTVCDSTWATPVLQRPLPLGCDLVVHASTKYLGGHGDVQGGLVVAKKAEGFFERVRRGIRTLPLRMRAHCEGAAAVARFLTGHGKVNAVHYPGLPHHPGHEIATRQMSGFGGMVSFQVSGGADAAMSVAAAATLFTRATSLGGTESLIEHRASIEAEGEGERTTTPDDLLRLSIGLEHPDDLIADLEAALGASS